MKLAAPRNLLLFTRAAACAALLLTAAPAQAVTFRYSNLNEVVEDSAGFDNTYMIAQSFTPDSSAVYFLLGDVRLRMDAADGSPNGNFIVSLYSNISNAPGTLTETLSGNATPLTAGNYTYNSVGAVLFANTTYWIVASATNTSGNYNWNYTNSTTHTGSWTTPGWSESFDGGSSWSIIEPTAPQMFAIAATAVVPEPATWSLLAGAAVLAAAVYRRRKATASRR